MGSPTIIYIAGRGHSGSTLLGLLLGAHSQVTYAGELKVLATADHRSTASESRCACGAIGRTRCPFWQRVAEIVSDGSGLSLWHDINAMAAGPERFAAYNQILLEAIARAGGNRFIVDSSRSIKRLQSLLAAGFDVRAIHLVRRPQGVVWSEKRRGRDWAHSARRYTFKWVKVRKVLAARDHFEVRYEELTRAPMTTVGAAMEWLGLNFETTQLEWATQPQHVLSGNYMRFAETSEIRVDEGWRDGLTAWQKLAIAWMTLPTRLRSTRWYELSPTLWGALPMSRRVRRWRKERTR